MNDILLYDYNDDGIMEALMYQSVCDPTGLTIKESGKSGDKRIYSVLRRLEKLNNVKL